MHWQKCESVYSGFMYDFGDVIFTTPDIFNPNAATSELYNSTFFALSNMSLISWNGYDKDLVDHSFGNLSIADTFYNVTSCCGKPTMSTPCKLKFDIVVILVVIICNALKEICMFLVVLKANNYPLITLGYAIASFLEHPDPTTKNICPVSKRDVLNNEFEASPLPKKWKKGTERMAEKEFYAVSARRWGFVNFVYVYQRSWVHVPT
jgi:hypothetical protein